MCRCFDCSLSEKAQVIPTSDCLLLPLDVCTDSCRNQHAPKLAADCPETLSDVVDRIREQKKSNTAVASQLIAYGARCSLSFHSDHHQLSAYLCKRSLATLHSRFSNYVAARRIALVNRARCYCWGIQSSWSSAPPRCAAKAHCPAFRPIVKQFDARRRLCRLSARLRRTYRAKHNHFH